MALNQKLVDMHSRIICCWIALFIGFLAFDVSACSMYKVTVHDKTMVGTNFDAYYRTPRIWFERGDSARPYGAAFSGGRLDGKMGYAPQSGMNEVGLSFSRLAAPTPETNLVDMSQRKAITNPNAYLKDILHQCKTIEEVEQFVNQYDHSYFPQDVFIYIEKSGRYLIVEPYATMKGDDSAYVLSNFCPTVTNAAYRHKLVRYHNGVEFLKSKRDTTIDFCTALSDTMHVCRKKLGDGTLLSSLWDLKSGMITLYFYHDYQHKVSFNIHEELAKGDHSFDIVNLFPPNAEFQKLCSIVTPQTHPSMGLFLSICRILLITSGLYLFIAFLCKRKTSINAKYFFVGAALNVVLLFFLVMLALNIAFFYASAPYQDYKFTLLTVAGYVPFLLLLLLFPILRINWKVMKETSWHFISKGVFTLNSLLYLVLFFLFAYWGFYSVWI